MVNISEAADWREARRRSARETIVDAAWALVGEAGLAALTIRDLARRAGITTPTVYAYFDSKSAIYDAMFGQAASKFADAMAAPFDRTDPREVLVESAQRFFEILHDRRSALPATFPANDSRLRTVDRFV